MNLYLQLHEGFKCQLLIDGSTFSFTGPTDGYDNNRRDCHIGFSLPEGVDVQPAADALREALMYRVEKTDYVGIRIKEAYETDQRPRIWIRLSSGMRGISSPPAFSLSSTPNEHMQLAG